MSTQRDPTLDAIRGIIVLLVVFLHACMEVAKYDVDPYARINWFISLVRMPLLMLISGFLASKYVGNRPVLAKRIVSLSWVVLLWTLPLNYAWEADNNLVTVFMPNTPLWFILSLLLYTSVVAMNGRPIVVVAVVGIIATAAYYPKDFDHEFIRRAAKNSIFFFVGVYYRPIFNFMLNGNPKKVGVVSAVLLMVFVSFDILCAKVLGWHAFGVLERFAGCGVMVVALRMLPLSVKTPAAIIGRQTLPIFLGHMLIEIPATKIMSAYFNPYILPWIVTVLAVFISLAVYWLSKAIGLGFIYEAPMALFNNKKTAVA